MKPIVLIVLAIVVSAGCQQRESSLVDLSWEFRQSGGGKATFASPNDEQEIMRFAVMGHVRASSQYAINPLFEASLNWIEKELLAPEFIVLAGDSIMGIHLNDHDFLRDWQVLLDFLETRPFSFLLAPGNHDYTSQSQRDIFEKLINPRYFSVKYKNSKLLFLDSVEEWVKRWSGRHFFMGEDSNLPSKKHLIGGAPFSSHGSPISKAQISFLQETIGGKDNKALRETFPTERPLYWADAEFKTEDEIRHSFIFVHHSPYKPAGPQWIENYQYNNWFQDVHSKLVGRSAFVFSGDARHNFPSANFVKDGVVYRTAWYSHDEGAFLLVRVMKDGDVRIHTYEAHRSNN